MFLVDLAQESQRNVERAGFRLAYTKVVVVGLCAKGALPSSPGTPKAGPEMRVNKAKGMIVITLDPR